MRTLRLHALHPHALRPHALLVAALALSACASAPPSPTTYAQLGGAEGVTDIVDDLLVVILEDDRINFQFAQTDIARFREKLIEQICVESGGPCTYTGLSMQESHAGRNIDNVQFNALVEGLVEVLEKRGVPVAAQNHLLRRLAPMHADIVGRDAAPTGSSPATSTPAATE
jgi:hemoglobin